MPSKPLPRITAQFEKNEIGEPAFVEANGRKHYKIVFEVQNPPEDAYAATFELDPTYYDASRTLRPDIDGKFRLETTSYGDYEVKVKLRTKQGEVLVANTLASALESSQDREIATPANNAAIAYIAKH